MSKMDKPEIYSIEMIIDYAATSEEEANVIGEKLSKVIIDAIKKAKDDGIIYDVEEDVEDVTIQ